MAHECFECGVPIEHCKPGEEPTLAQETNVCDHCYKRMYGHTDAPKQTPTFWPQCNKHNWRGLIGQTCSACKTDKDVEELRTANTEFNRCRAHNWAGVSVCPKCAQAAQNGVVSDKTKSAFKFAAEFYDTYYAHGKQPKTPVDFTAAFVECIVQWENNKQNKS